MSGHSKWSTIKHKKAKLDARRGKNWSKLARDITMAAKSSGNPEDNPRLRLAVDKAKGANMPKDTIEKAIKKGTGELAGESYEEIVYEGYGAGGVAIMARALTDNRNRTAGEIKKIFERGGGNLGASNCVAWMFSTKGVVIVGTEGVSEERLMEVALEAGAEDVKSYDTEHEVTCTQDVFMAVRSAIESAGIAVKSADITTVAGNYVSLDAENARKIIKLVEMLEDQDDVESVATNLDIPDEVMKQL
ncbi:MAG: YebC/PmpR family DNA-binding transcriptional regulator [Phycisphaerales bacterium]|nr:YebC/PmpR family DNA-binding transcriptional regulator [Phycisphaerales bacterium]